MSTNLHVRATRKVTFVKRDGTTGNDVQTEVFDMYQTPSSVTRAALASNDPADVYIGWLLSMDFASAANDFSDWYEPLVEGNFQFEFFGC